MSMPTDSETPGFCLGFFLDICKLGDLAYVGEFAKLGKNLSRNLENAC